MARETGDITDPREAAARQDTYKKFMAKFDTLSPWHRQKNSDGSTEISREISAEKTEKYRLARLQYPEGKEDKVVDEKVGKLHKIFTKIFGRGEVDPPKTTRAAMKGEVVDDEEKTPDIPLIVTTIENENGEIVGGTHSAILESLDSDFSGKGKSFALGAYNGIDKGERNKKLGMEMFRHRLELLIDEAEKQGKPLDSIVAEVHGEAEQFYNKAGLKRLYFKGQDQKMHEVEYHQFPLVNEIDKNTGKPEDGEKIPEHLMIAQLDGRNEITTEELLEKVRAIMDYNNIQTEGYFGKNKKAYEEHLRIVAQYLKEFEDTLPKDGRIALMSAEEREQLLGFDKELFVEHTAADER